MLSTNRNSKTFAGLTLTSRSFKVIIENKKKLYYEVSKDSICIFNMTMVDFLVIFRKNFIW